MPNKKIITRLLINNWGGISRQIMEFSQYVNLFSGMSGSGKSTVMDAIQVLLYGSLSPSFLNKAADERSRRTVTAYLKGAQKDGSLNRGAEDFCSTLVMEIKDTADQSFRCAGAAFDVRAGENQISRYSFFSHEGPLDLSLYRGENQVPMTVKEIAALVKRYQKESKGRLRGEEINRMYPTNDAYQSALYGPILGYIDGRRFVTMEKSAVALKMSNGVGQFIRDYMFPKSESGAIEKISRQLGDYRDIRDIVADLEKRIQLLEQVRQEDQKLVLARAKVMETESGLKQLSVIGMKEEIARAQRDMEQYSQELLKAQEAQEEIRRSMEQSQEELVEIRSQLKAGDYGKRREQLKQLEETIRLLEKNQQAWEGLKARLKQWEDCQEIWDLAGNQAVQALEEIEKGQAEEGAFGQLRQGLGEVLEEVNEQRDNLVQERRQVAKDLEEKSQRLKDMRSGRKSYRSRQGLTEARRDLEQALFRETGRKIPVMILADTFDVTDVQWKDAVEGRMGISKYSLILPPGYSALAAGLFASMKQYENVGLLNVQGIMDLNPQAEEGSLYEAVETDLDYADVCLKYFLGRIIKCRDVRELITAKEGVTKDCCSSSGFTLRHLKRKDYRDNACIGRTVSKGTMEKLEQEIEDLKERQQKLQAQIEILGRAPGYERLAQEDSYYMDLQQSVQELAKSRERRRGLEEELARLEQGSIKELNQRLGQVQKRYQEQEDAYAKASAQAGQLQASKASAANRRQSLLLRLQEALEGFEVKETQARELEKRLEGRSLQSLQNQLNRELEQARTQEEEALKGRLEARFAFNRTYAACGLTGTEASNQAYDQLYERYSSQYVKEYKEEFDRKCQEIYRSLRDNVIAAIHGDIKAAYRQVREINRVLGATSFSDSVYKIGISPASNENRQFYDMLMAEELDSKVMTPEDVEGQLSLGEDQFFQKYDKEIRLLVEKFIPQRCEDEKEVQKRMEEMEKYADYRTYLTFNMYEVTVDEQGKEKRIPVDEMAGNDSGGEGQNPKYVALFAGFALLFAQAAHRESRIRIVLLDEAFSKMDKMRSSVCLNYARRLGLQVIICVPDERLMTLVKNVDCVYGFCRIKNKISMIMIDKGKYLDMLEGEVKSDV